MAVSITGAITATIGGTTVSGSTSKSITQSGTGIQATVQSIGLTTEALTFTDIDDIGYLYLKNEDSTNFVLIGLTSPVNASNAMVHLLAGEVAMFPTRQETIYAIADTGACLLHIVAAER